ncbi:MAG: hypothetical protein HY255_02370 [Betaproteobacteria bacterium]|nr:hypothetical protein [Betaproteobacteria bacterium]
MSSGERDKFSAAAPALGYFYQCRYALLAALRRLPDSDAFCIYIETLDDVVFESEGGPVELLQTKHKLNHETDLSDSSTDLWKSLRIWLEGTKNGSIPVDAQLFLLTTATCVAGAAVSYLRSDELRDITKVITRLDSIASTSTNKTNEDGYTLFRELESASKKQFLERVIVLDAAPTIADLDDLLRRAVYYAVERKFLNLFLEKMEGWWLRRLLKHLITTPATPILSG